jgi:hypothetical protein
LSESEILVVEAADSEEIETGKCLDNEVILALTYPLHRKNGRDDGSL